MLKNVLVLYAVVLFLAGVVKAGLYTQPGVNGYVGQDRRHAAPEDSDAVINPIFKHWASGYVNYKPAPGVNIEWLTPQKTLGSVTGNIADVASLGDLSQSQINQGVNPGEITLTFGIIADEPIRDVNGLDFVVFENGLFTAYDVHFGLASGNVFAELGYVEVSTDPNHFVRFPSVSLTPCLINAWGTIDMTDVYNLAGKHPNGYGTCTGTAFDLSQLSEHPMVLDGTVDLNNIKYVRIVDIPGSGDFFDDANDLINPNTWADYQRPLRIYDPWETYGSGGFDLEAIGVLKEQNKRGDVNLDGLVDEDDLCIFMSAWLSQMGDANWNQRCNLAEPKDFIINNLDFAVIVSQWRQNEEWALP